MVMSKEPWQIRLSRTPVWYYIRFHWTGTVPTSGNRAFVSFINLLSSVFQIIYFLFIKQFRVDSVYFSLARKDCLDFYKYVSEREKCDIFVQYENVEQSQTYKYKTSDGLNAIRYICRRLGNLRSKQKQALIAQFEALGFKVDSALSPLIGYCIGDLYFNRFLSLVIRKKLKVYYSISVVPQTEKFEHLMNSFEVQHGIIHSTHFSYFDVPDARGGMVVYHPIYQNILAEIGYSGPVTTYDFKENHQSIQPAEKFDAVIFTQPDIWKKETVENLFQALTKKLGRVRIQKHPRDYRIYDLPGSIFVRGTHPLQTKTAICFTSTTIEDFLVHQKKVVIFDPEKILDLENAAFKVYRRLTSKDPFIYCTSIEEVIAASDAPKP